MCKELFFMRWKSNQYSVSANPQVWVSELVLESKKWYRNISKSKGSLQYVHSKDK